MKLKTILSKITTKVLPYRYQLDEVTDNRVRGWAKSTGNASCSVAIKVTSSSNTIVVVANHYRADVRRVGQHTTGFCGFSVDVSTWKNKKLAVKVLGEVIQKELPEFSPYFFIHIPKTAGTSFKMAAQNYLGVAGVARNYGPKSIESTSWVTNAVVNNNDYTGLYNRLCNEGISLYMGHTHLMPVANVFKASHLVTMLRDPVSQVLSHYNHYCRWYNYSKPVSEFVTSLGFKNIQSRFLKGMPLQLLGLIGITERYDESLSLYNNLACHNLKPRIDNVNDKKPLKEVSSELINLIKAENTEDLVLYAWAKRVFQQRIALYKNSQPWCFSYIDKLEINVITGVAYWEHSDEQVELIVYSGNTVLGKCMANEIRPGLLRFGAPNKGYIGFRLAFSTDQVVDTIQVKVATTGQVLDFVKYA